MRIIDLAKHSMWQRHRARTTPSAEVVRQLGDIAVAMHLPRLRFCIICHYEMTDEICCTCETPTVLKTSA